MLYFCSGMCRGEGEEGEEAGKEGEEVADHSATGPLWLIGGTYRWLHTWAWRADTKCTDARAAPWWKKPIVPSFVTKKLTLTNLKVLKARQKIWNYFLRLERKTVGLLVFHYITIQTVKESGSGIHSQTPWRAGWLCKVKFAGRKFFRTLAKPFGQPANQNDWPQAKSMQNYFLLTFSVHSAYI